MSYGRYIIETQSSFHDIEGKSMEKSMRQFSMFSLVLKKHQMLFFIIGIALIVGCDGGKEQLNVFTWSGYVSEDIRKGFETEYGVNVIVDTYANNEDLLAKLQAGATGYDIIMPSDYMVSIMIKENLLAELNRDNIPNLQNISPLFLNKYFDANNTYSVPYTFGTAGIAYDSSVVSPAPDSWSILWDEKYKNQFSMLDDGRESLGAALKLLGYSFNTTDPEELKQAKDKLIQQRSLVKQYKTEAEELLIPGEVIIAHCWSGDAFRAAEVRPSIRYIIPKEGSSQFIDNVCILKSAPHKDLAEKFINYLLRPEVNAKITEFTKYGTCVPEAKKHLPEDLQKHEFIYPPAEIMESLEWLIDQGDFTKQYSRAWDEVKAK